MDHPELPHAELYRVASDEPIGSIGVPVRDFLNAATATALLTSSMRGSFGPPGTHVDFNLIQGSVLPLQRNELVQRMRGDWLMFIDDDMVWQPDQISRLIEEREANDLDILGALCFRRTSPYNPTMYMRQGPDAGLYNFLEDWDEDAIVEVDATGMAFIIIHKRVFEWMVAHYEGRPGWEMPPYEERVKQNPPNFFRWEGLLGEDLRFCQEAKAAGARVWVHTGIEVGHVGEHTVRRREFLQELALRDEKVLTPRREMNAAMGLPTMERAEAQRRLGWTRG